MSGRPTVAVDCRVLVDAPAGVGYATRALLGELAKRGRFRIIGMCHRPPRDTEALAAAGVEFEVLRAPYGLWWQQFTLPRRLARGRRAGGAEGRVDLFWSPVATLPKKLQVPGVVTVHDLTPLLFPYWHSWRNRVTFKRQLPSSLDHAAHVVASSAATAADLERRFPWTATKLSVAHLGVDPSFRPADPTLMSAIRRSLDATRGYALFVGTLEPRKNLHTLLDAWQLVRDKLREPPPLFVAGGKGWRSRGVRRRLSRAPGVRYLGRLSRTRLIEVLQGASVFVYPSLYEGFGLPVAEAMACGVPVVTSDSSSLPEVVDDAGFTIHPQHKLKLAAAIERVLTDPALAERLRARGMERAKRFTWARCAEATEAAFDRAIGRS